MSAAGPAGPVRQAKALVERYLDARARWSVADDDAARALREDPEARKAWAVAIATHRALVGAEAGMPSGVERRRQVDLAMARAGVVVSKPRIAWLRLALPLVTLAAVILFATLSTAPPVEDEWLRARGLSEIELPGPRVGLGVGGVTEGGREYEAIASGEVHLDDWLRFSYTNERPELGFLYVFGLQSEAGVPALRPIAPLPDEGTSLPITTGHFVQLAFETRLAARHTAGPLRLVALFTTAPLTVEVVAKAVADLDPDATRALPSEVEARLRERLPLSPGDVVQLLDTTIVPGSATLLPPGPRQETP